MKKQNKGITLVALVITIIILLILAGIVINLTIGQRGILTRAREAGKNYGEAQQIEENILNSFENTIYSKEKLPVIPKISEKIVLVNTDTDISELFYNAEGIKSQYLENEISNISQLPMGNYKVYYDEKIDSIEVIESDIDTIVVEDQSKNGYHLKLKDATIEKDENGCYMNFDGKGYGQLQELPETIDWESGFTIEFDAAWNHFRTYERILEFCNGQPLDNINVINWENRSNIGMQLCYDSWTSYMSNEILTQGTKTHIKIEEEKKGEEYVLVYYKDGVEFYRNENVTTPPRNVKRTECMIGVGGDKDNYFDGKLYNLTVSTKTNGIVIDYRADALKTDIIDLTILGEGYKGNIKDLSKNGYHLKLKGATIEKDENGYYMNFNGQGYGKLRALPETIDWESGFTIEFDASWNHFGTYERILEFCNGQPLDNINVINWENRSNIGMQLCYDSWASYMSDEILTPGTKTHIKIEEEKQGEQYVLVYYKDGVEFYRNENVTTPPRNVKRTECMIGVGSDKDNYFNGKLYNLTVSTKTNGMVLKYDINELYNLAQ